MNRMILFEAVALARAIHSGAAKSVLQMAFPNCLNPAQMSQFFWRRGAVECHTAGQLASPSIDNFLSPGGFIPCIHAAAAL
jgi:hypothetical protein